MLLTVVSVALLIDSCVSTNSPRPGFVDQLPERCPGNDGTTYSIVTQTLFSLINELRWKIASGQKVQDMQEHGGPKLMCGAKWSCELEKKASQLLKPREKTSELQEADETTLPTHVVLNFTSANGRSRGAKINDVFKQMKGDTNGRSMLTSSNVPFFGCAYEETKEKGTQSLKVLCVFKRNSNEDSNKHSSCSNNDDCSQYPGSTCSDKLCWAPTQEAI